MIQVELDAPSLVSIHIFIHVYVRHVAVVARVYGDIVLWVNEEPYDQVMTFLIVEDILQG